MSSGYGRARCAVIVAGALAALAVFPQARAQAQAFQEPGEFARSQVAGISGDLTAYAKTAQAAGAPLRLSGARFVLASWYGGGERLNAHTANGERFNPGAMTAAHRTLPMGARLLVAYAGRSVVVRINDRGPARWTGRALDLSRAAARALGITGAGVARVAIRRVA